MYRRSYPAFTNYADMLAYFKTCKSPKKGKPFATWARIFLEGDTLVVQGHRHPCFKVTPDNVIEFDINQGLRHTMSQVLRTMVPFDYCNVATGTYAIVHTPTLRDTVQTRRELGESISYLQLWRTLGYVSGVHPLRFNMLTGECLNPPGVPLQLALKDKDKEANRIWLRLYKNFTRQIRLRDKLGVVDRVFADACEEFRQASMTEHGRPDCYYTKSFDINPEVVLQMLHTAVKDGEVTTQLLKILMTDAVRRHVAWRWGRSDTDPMRYINQSLRKHSIRLRLMFGVFNNDKVTTND